MRFTAHRSVGMRFEEMARRTLTEWRYSSSIQRVHLVYYFRCFHDLVESDVYLRSLLIIDARKYLEDEESGDPAIVNFCKIILRHNQCFGGESPLFIAERGTSFEAEYKILSQIKCLPPLECLQVVQEFPNYRQLAKRNVLMRSLLIKHAYYTSTCLGDSELRQFSADLLEEFKFHDNWLDAQYILADLKSLETEDLLLDITCNEYHLDLVSRCRFTVNQIMRFFEENFPNLHELTNILSVLLREDKCDKYLDKVYYHLEQVMRSNRCYLFHVVVRSKL